MRKDNRQLNYCTCLTIFITMQYLVDYCSCITSLDLYGCKKITDAALFCISNSKHAKSLNKLMLSWVGLITNQGLISIGKACTNLEKLSLHGTNIKDFESFLILMPQLEYLDVGATKEEAATQAIANYCSNLQTLKLKEGYYSNLPLVFKSNTKVLRVESVT